MNTKAVNREEVTRRALLHQQTKELEENCLAVDAFGQGAALTYRLLREKLGESHRYTVRAKFDAEHFAKEHRIAWEALKEAIKADAFYSLGIVPATGRDDR